MEAGITDHVWSVEELVTRALAAEPCAVPEPKPLAPPAPPPGEKPATARQTSTGGWLRVVQGGKSAQNDAPKAPTPPVTPAAKPVMEASAVAQERAKVTPTPCVWTQLDLFPLNPRLDE